MRLAAQRQSPRKRQARPASQRVIPPAFAHGTQSPSPLLQAKLRGEIARVPGDEAAANTPISETLASPGVPLDSLTRSKMESSLGFDFGHVRLHQGAQATESARRLNARAFTSGHHVVFAQNQYAPSSRSGRRLLAHELAHVVQQTRSPAAAVPSVQRQRQSQNQSLLLSSAPSFPGCSPYQRFRLDNQLLRARTLVQSGLSGVSEELNRAGNPGSGIITIAGSALSRYFHTSNPRHLRTIRDRLQRILRRLSRGPRNWRCRTTAGCRGICEPVAGGALACASPSGPVSICPSHFQSGNLAGALTLVHEAAHQAGLGLRTPAGHRTDIYEHEARFANLTTHQAMNAPDAYAAFVRDTMYGGPLSGGRAWTAGDMAIIGSIWHPNLTDLVGTSRNNSAGLGRFPPRTVVRNRFNANFVFDAFNPGTGRRPDFLRSPEVGLQIVLRRGRSRAGRPRQSVLFDQSAHAAPNQLGRMNPPGTANGHIVDFPFDTADRGTLNITARIRDEDTATTLTFRARLPVRPTASPPAAAGSSSSPSPTTPDSN